MQKPAVVLRPTAGFRFIEPLERPAQKKIGEADKLTDRPVDRGKVCRVVITFLENQINDYSRST